MADTIYRYMPCEEMDWILLQWLSRMRHDGELDKTLSKGVHFPSAFLQFFQAPRQLFFQVDAFGNLKRACWFEPCMGSVFLSYYASPGHRRERETPYFMFDVLQWLFDSGVPVVCGLVQDRPKRQETFDFIKLHEKMGYEYSGTLPKFFDGKDCHLVALTAESWSVPNKIKDRWQRDRSKKAQSAD